MTFVMTIPRHEKRHSFEVPYIDKYINFYAK